MTMTEVKKENDGSISIHQTDEENKKWHEEFYARQERKKKGFKESVKPQIMKILKDMKIDRVEIYYSGSGDDGSMEDATFYVGKDTINLNEKHIVDIGERKYWCHTDHTYKYTTDPMDLKDYIEEMAYDYLEAFHGGWEINEGQSGNIIFDVVQDKISHDYVCYVEHSEVEEI